MADKIVRALVTKQTYINGVLHLPGEHTDVNLTELGVSSLNDKDTPGLEPVSKSAAEPIEQAPIAAVAPHAPDAPNPQGLATGTVQSGTGRLLVPDAYAGKDEPAAIEPVGADKPGAPGEQTPQKPAKK